MVYLELVHIVFEASCAAAGHKKMSILVTVGFKTLYLNFFITKDDKMRLYGSK